MTTHTQTEVDPLSATDAPTTVGAQNVATAEVVRIITHPGANPDDIRKTVADLEARGVEILVLADDFHSGFDAVQVAAYLAPLTNTIKIVPEVPITHTEPFHIATATATLDHDSLGRAGWSPTVQTSTQDAELIGRRGVADAESTWREAGDIDEVITRLWLSWEPDAEIRDVETSRFLDASKVHYADFTGTDSVGEEFSVFGSSIVPRSPQGELPTLVTVTDEPSANFAAQHAELVILSAQARAAGFADLVERGAQERGVDVRVFDADQVETLTFGQA